MGTSVSCQHPDLGNPLPNEAIRLSPGGRGRPGLRPARLRGCMDGPVCQVRPSRRYLSWIATFAGGTSVASRSNRFRHPSSPPKGMEHETAHPLLTSPYIAAPPTPPHPQPLDGLRRRGKRSCNRLKCYSFPLSADWDQFMGCAASVWRPKDGLQFVYPPVGIGSVCQRTNTPLGRARPVRVSSRSRPAWSRSGPGSPK